MILQLLDELHEQTGWNYRRLCAETGVPFGNLQRWRTRQRAGALRWQKPGPKKLVPVDWEQLNAQVRDLRHGRHRSRGTGRLYREHQASLSRRDLQALVAQARRECQQRRATLTRCIHWREPALVWSIDDAELLSLTDGVLRLHNIHDLGSRYKHRPLLGRQLPGPRIAAHLDELFRRHGAPVVLKRDNGGNLNHAEVDAVLTRYAVIALNSPRHYPPYNGGMERAQREVKEAVRVRRGDGAASVDDPVWSVVAESVIHDLNHRARPCLRGADACRTFATGKVKLAAYTLPKRKEIIHWITTLAQQLLADSGKNTPRQRAIAWRLAVETWLEQNGSIEITSHQQNVSPI